MAKYQELIGGSKMPSVGLGTWQSNNEEELELALNIALETGYRHIDTAYVYENEHVIGRVLHKWLSTKKLRREELFVTTKLPMCAINPDRVEKFIKKSLENLQLDYVDLYLVHFPVGSNYVEGHAVTPTHLMKMEDTDHVAVWKKMEDQVDSGRARSIGLSNFNRGQVEKILKSSRIKPACLQIEIHLAMQQNELVKFCHQNNIVVVAYSPLCSPGINKFLEQVGQGGKALPNMMQHPTVSDIAQKHNKSKGQVMLRFLIQKDVVPIPKSITPTRIKENIDVFDFILDAKDMKALEDLNIGESARIFDFKFFPALTEHPEYPFKA